MSKTDKHLEIELLNTNYNDDETLLKDLMSQKIETKKDFDLPTEISHKTKASNDGKTSTKIFI